MTKKPDPQEAIDLANSILMSFDENKIDLPLAYAALGCAFIQLHLGLGFGELEWIQTTKEMAKRTWSKNEN